MYFLKVMLISGLISTGYCQTYTITSKIYMDVKQNKKPLGRIVFGLFGKESPKAVENFRHICLKGINGKTYIGSSFHRVVDRFIIQGGDIVSNDGHGSVSIYGKYFDDENTNIDHNKAGYLGMANRGPNTNGCQFYVTTVTTKWLTGKHTVFGRVVEGMDVVHEIESVKTDTEDKPLQQVTITNCGEMPTDHYEFDPNEFNAWGWVKAAGPGVALSLGVMMVFHYFFRQLDQYC